MYRRIIPAVVVIALLGLLIFSYRHFRSGGPADSSSVTVDTSQANGSLITTALPVRRTFTRKIPWIGTVEARSSVELVALVPGRVETIIARDQSPVEKGQPVMKLGGPQIEDAHAKLLTGIESLERQLVIARQTVKRHKETLGNRLSTSDQLAAAQEAEAGLEAQLGDARLNLETLENRISITSPVKGIFTNRQISAGQDVSAGQTVGEVIDTGRLRVVASLFTPEGIDIQGKDAIIRLNENRTLPGIVNSVLPQASDTGATSVWIEGRGIDGELHPGQTVEGVVIARTSPGALAVPESAIVYDSQGHPCLFIYRKGSYEPAGIRTGLEQDGYVEVLSGLKQDQLVVTRGAYELFYKNFTEQFKVRD